MLGNLAGKRFIASLLLVLATWALVYQDALLSMEDIWSRSDTFAHGYFVLPISLWLIWRDKKGLSASQVRSTWLPLPLLVISLFVGLLSYAADINVLRQFSAVTSLIFLLWSLLGNKLAWRYKFPLAYLLFAVPMGENLIPWLQDVTAWFTVFFLKLNGIPVFVDGLYIQIPTGMFEVAVACSGIRYLIASLAVGSLYGYITYTKLHKQLIFFVFALCLPILANGIRAYGIVAIAYYSDMKYATGADHLIYGWIFFGFVIMLMFWVGGFFADTAKSHEALNQTIPSTSAVGLKQRMYLLPLLCLSLLVFTFSILKSIPLLEIEKRTNPKEARSSWGISFTNAFEKTHEKDNQGLEIFSAVYGNKQNKGELITWKNVTHDHGSWTIIVTSNRVIDGKPVKLVHLKNIKGKQRSYVYQYKVGDYYTFNSTKAKLMQAWNSLTRQSDYSEIRAISIAGKEIAQAEDELLAQFSQQFKGYTKNE